MRETRIEGIKVKEGGRLHLSNGTKANDRARCGLDLKGGYALTVTTLHDGNFAHWYEGDAPLDRDDVCAKCRESLSHTMVWYSASREEAMKGAEIRRQRILAANDAIAEAVKA